MGTAFGRAPVWHAVPLIQPATPVTVTSWMQTEKRGADSAAVAGLVVASTLSPVVNIPLSIVVPI